MLLGDLVGLHKATRANAGAARLASLLLAVGLPAGLWLYRLKIAAGWGALGLHRTIGIKFVLLSHNTKMGAAKGAVLLAEYLVQQGVA